MGGGRERERDGVIGKGERDKKRGGRETRNWINTWRRFFFPRGLLFDFWGKKHQF